MSIVELHQVARIQARFDRIAERAAARGFTGGLRLEVGEPYQRTETLAGGWKRTATLVELTVAGEPARYDGWAVNARIDTLASGAMVAINAPGVDQPIDLGDYETGSCEHCGVRRRRNETYVVEHTDGTRKFVGSTCLKDFLGWSAQPYLIFGDQLDVDDLLDASWDDDTYPVAEVLFWSVLSIADRGYRRSGEEASTRDEIFDLLTSSREPDRDRRLQLLAGADSAATMDKVAGIVDYIASDDFAGDSSYVPTLKALAAEASIETKHLGYVVSAPTAYARHQANLEQRKAREKQHAEATVAPVPTGKHTVAGTILSVQVKEDDYRPYGGTVLKMTVLDDRGFRIYSTAPRKIVDAVWIDERYEDRGTDTADRLKGLRIRFDATLTPSSDDSQFGFAKRPTKPTLLDQQTNDAASDPDQIEGATR